MATNLRLNESAAAAVRAEAERTGRSQQDVIRAAVDWYLSPRSNGPDRTHRQELIPPTLPFKHDIKRRPMPEGVTSLDLLDRDDRG